ncbi:acyl-CoA dehydrogenase family protein [Streptomyces brasiliensis]|uniref:Acyl-CoA dehydrogenase n=1 Tax=Streptomyces brasiliensis TaxID=1954 RepID=A0A917KQG9_9ACTN|nr:acyl-CoA dehydrogenase family protein [Streptomyces brasiliensis]GGJ22736.1 acyl-CoA dehydrogenase [Streptomyces brasiliensis]
MLIGTELQRAVQDGQEAPGQEARAATRVAELDRRLGDPTDDGNELSYTRLLEADEAGELSEPGERALDELGLGADFVPRAEGGRLERLDTLVRIMRQVFRRDVALGLGYGVTSFMAAVNIWTSGDAAQRACLARILTGGGKVSVAYHELAHGNDFVRNEFEARPAEGGGYLLNGAKQVINNAQRADAWVLFSRTSPAPGSRSHSVLFVERDGLDTDTWQVLPRYDTVGVRGCLLSGLRFDDTPVPASALVGEPGKGVETALRAFQITRSALPGMAVGTTDTALRTVVRFALGRQLYRKSVMDIPHARGTLSGAFVDLLTCDSLSLAATRAVHLLPEQTSVFAAATKYLVPKVLTDAMHELSIVLGARFYIRDGEHGIFQKHLRDMPVLSLGHAGSAACQATIIPQLSRLARRSWFSDEPAPAQLFQPRTDLPDLSYGRLTLASGRDGLSATLVAAVDQLPGASPEERAVQGLALQLVDELRQVQEASRALAPEDRTALARPAAFALADRYAVLLAAASAIGVRQQASHDGGDAFLADPAWLAAALHRLARRLGRRPADLPASVDARVHEEVLRRFHARTSYDLYDTPPAG